MFWRGIIGYLPVQAVQAIAGFGAVVVFTRLLTPHEYGQYALALAAAALVHTVFLTWTEAAMERFYMAEAEQGDLPAHFVTLHRAFGGIAALVLLLTLIVLLAAPADPALRAALGAGVAGIVTRGALKLLQERRRAEGRVAAYAVTDVIYTAASFGLGAVLAVAGWGAVAPLAGAGIAAFVMLLSGLPEELRRGRGGRFEPARARRYAAYGLPVALSLILGLVLSSTDRFLIAAFLDEGSVGVYHAGYGLASRTQDVLFAWLGLASGPAMIAALEREGRSALRRAAHEQAEIILLIAAPASVGLALVAEPLAQALVGPEMSAGAARVIPWIAAGGFFAGVTGYYLDQSFILAKRPGLMLLSVVVPALSNVALNLVLIPSFGLDGAMWATTISFVLGALTSYLLGRRLLPLPIPWNSLLRCIVAAGLMALAVLAMPAPGGLLEVALKAAGGALVYAALALMLDIAGARSRARKLIIAGSRRIKQPPPTGGSLVGADAGDLL